MDRARFLLFPSPRAPLLECFFSIQKMLTACALTDGGEELFHPRVCSAVCADGCAIGGHYAAGGRYEAR